MNNSQCALAHNPKLKIPKSSAAVSPKTIFAFLTLDTPRSAHKEILSAKFLSFERAAIVC